MKLTVFNGSVPPPFFNEAIALLKPDLNVELTQNGIPLHIKKGDALSVLIKDAQIYITWQAPVHMFRALSLLPTNLLEGFSVTEKPCFKECGIMLDVSRNAVLKLDSLQSIFRKMALMGLSLGMMYTEDTYEVPQHPYFGYMRGRYSQEELRQADEYANILGIELIPCIQTLGHLNRILHWPTYAHLKDNEEVLLCDDKQVHSFLQEIISAASAPYKSKRIHIGMDEAHGIGLGRHLSVHGYESPHSIIKRHLKIVADIVKEKNLKAMMWSDMFFRPNSKTNGYYDGEMPTQEAINAVLPNVTQVYWDYYHQDQSEYDKMLNKHSKLGAEIAFAGGIWTWCGPAPDYTKTIATARAALPACKNAGVQTVFQAAWGDNGAEANMFTAFYGMQIYAEYNYSGKYNEQAINSRFEKCCHVSAEAFLNLSGFNRVLGMHTGPVRPANAAKFLLYQDPFIQLYANDTKGLKMSAHYAELMQKYIAYSATYPNWKWLFSFYAQLARVLSLKCEWHENAQKMAAEKDYVLAKHLLEVLKQAQVQSQSLRTQWYKVWNKTNKPYGFEIIDGRLGAVIARLQTAQMRTKAFIKNKDTLQELCEVSLPYTVQSDGALFGSYAMGEIVSACKIDT